MNRRYFLLSSAGVAISGCVAAAPRSFSADPAVRRAWEWPVYGATNAATKYSPLAGIHGGNFNELKIAWEWRSPDEAIISDNPDFRPGEFQATPIMVDGRLFVSTAMSQVCAIDPETGRTLWVHDPGTWRNGYPTSKGFQHRGVAYWRREGDARVFIATGDNRLIALKAEDGAPVASFGEGGEVDLRVSGRRKPVEARPADLFGTTSPPLIVGDTVVVGQYIHDRVVKDEMPPGDVRGFDAYTGSLKWVFNIIPGPGEPGSETWRNGLARGAGNANVWAPMSADDEAGIVYLPTSCPTNNFFGGDRPGDNLFANSIVALDAETGERLWHFQIVHHDIWDYDLPCAPILMDIHVEGRPRKAVAQLTKQGYCFVFDRITGEPVWPIEEKPVPQTKLAAEWTSPTQPAPAKPPPFERQGLTRDDLIDFTPELRAEAEEIFSRLDAGPLFTPLGPEPTVVLPSWVGGANWWGGAFDPETARLFVPSISVPVAMALDEDGRRIDSGEGVHEIAGRTTVIRGPQGMSLLKPPYGRITAFDMNEGEIDWTRPNGPGAMDADKYAPFNTGWLGTTARTGPLVTPTALFMGEGPHHRQARKVLRAYEKASGDVLGEVPLPDNTLGPPMTYAVDGRQYIVCGMGFRGSPHRLVALALA
ncbi:PQQ-binding-like beta-propeller repeat protein [Hyphococcus luteus]|uniref:outer membrane protein assembly factor BamB family protein n=1 Tax=Hyphococcus luteus TaxID=2058213 RepID=UPI0013FD63D1|nr:PQQ-binding-like beta-propeller repeat protein [Marinicaulis flavus]